MKITVKQILIDYLKSHDCDGLAGDSCGCGIDDFAACESCSMDCQPAKKIVVHCDDCTTLCDAAGVGNDGYCYKPVEIKDRPNFLGMSVSGTIFMAGKK